MPGGLTPQEHNAWIQFGGGQELWDEMYAEFGLRAWLAGNAGTQMIGWFRKPIRSVDDLSGLKIRMAGLHAEVFNRLGATSVNMAGGEIMAALQSGLIDAAEWGGPWMDLAFGFYKVAKYCYGPGVHEPGAAQSLVVNLKAYEALPADLKEIVRAAADVETVRLLSEFTVMNARARHTLVNEHGVTMELLPESLLKRWFEVSADVVAETAAEGDLNRRIYDNWTKFRQAVIDFGPFSEFGYMKARLL